jgi:hypothetical protein
MGDRSHLDQDDVLSAPLVQRCLTALAGRLFMHGYTKRCGNDGYCRNTSAS